MYDMDDMSLIVLIVFSAYALGSQPSVILVDFRLQGCGYTSDP